MALNLLFTRLTGSKKYLGQQETNKEFRKETTITTTSLNRSSNNSQSVATIFEPRKRVVHLSFLKIHRKWRQNCNGTMICKIRFCLFFFSFLIFQVLSAESYFSVVSQFQCSNSQRFALKKKENNLLIEAL